jgi:hypothetical protein
MPSSSVTELSGDRLRRWPLSLTRPAFSAIQTAYLVRPGRDLEYPHDVEQRIAIFGDLGCQPRQRRTPGFAPLVVRRPADQLDADGGTRQVVIEIDAEQARPRPG